MALRAVRLATTITLIAAAAGPSIAQRIGRDTLDPKTYTSPSGEFKLRVDPSTIYGQGEGSYRMTRGDAEVWTKKLPFTLWDAGVTDDGTVAGYAYSLGRENYSLDRTDREEGKLHLVILDQRGELRMNTVFPRRGTNSCTSSIDRSATGIIVDAENDRFVVRADENGRGGGFNETWRTYRLSDGTLRDEFEFGHPTESGAHELWRPLAARAVSGTPLILVNWEYTKWAEDGTGIAESGACFALIDALGNPVWEKVIPGDYPEYYEFSKRLDRKKDRAEFDRLMRLSDEIGSKSAVLRTNQPRCFDLWFVKEGQCVTFQLEKEVAGSWRVVEAARTAYAIANEASDKDPRPEPLALRHLGAIDLKIPVAAEPEIRDIDYFDLDDRDRIGFLRSEKDKSTTFVLIDSDGRVIRSVPLKAPFGESFNLSKATWIGGDRWLVTAHTWRNSAEGEPDESRTRAWWLDIGSGALAAIESFSGQGARHVATMRDGGFVATIHPPFGSNQPEVVAAFDCDGKQRWRTNPSEGDGVIDATSGLSVTTDRRIVVECSYGDKLAFLDADGKFIKAIACADLLGTEGADADSVAADLDGGLIVVADGGQSRVFRARSDGSIQTSFAVQHPDGRSVALDGVSDQTDIRVGNKGVLWASDGHSFLRLNPAGVVERVLGEPPDSPELRQISAVAIDQRGNTYLASGRNGFTLVLDPTGKQIRTLRPAPTDFSRDWEPSEVHVVSDQTVLLGTIRFSTNGDRVGPFEWPSGVEAGYFRFPAYGKRYWIVGDEQIFLIGEDNTVERTIARRPNGDWLDHIEASAVAPNGSLAVVAGRLGLGREHLTISLYGPSGDSIKSVSVPRVAADRSLRGGFSYNGDYALTTAGYDPQTYLLLDVRGDTPHWYDLGKLAPYEDRWEPFFVNDGKELWLLGEHSRKIERFALPAAVETAGS